MRGTGCKNVGTRLGRVVILAGCDFNRGQIHPKGWLAPGIIIGIEALLWNMRVMARWKI
jgi:hypothetical protein